jgi:hypothetical protein
MVYAQIDWQHKLATILMIAIGALMRVNYYQPDEWHSSNRIR